MNSKELYNLIQNDITDRNDFAARQRERRRERLCSNMMKRLPYPGSPDLREPLIDDYVTHITANEMNILWSARVLAVFYATTSDSLRFKRYAESAFDLLLKRILNVRSKIESALDCKNERGFSICQMTVNTTAMQNEVLPDFEPVDPIDVVVPTVCRRISEADRITRIYRYTEREFYEEGKRNGWNNVQKVIEKFSESEGDDESGNDYSGESRTKNGEDSSQYHGKEIIVYECYHYKKSDSGVYNKWVTIFCMHAPEVELKSFEWRWPDKTESEAVYDQNGMLVRPEIIAIGNDRPWPFVQFRYENRTQFYHDTRGIADKLKQDQKIATTNLRLKALMMDYTAKPFLRGPASISSSFKWRPGDRLPEGTEVVAMAAPTQVFDYNADLARASAARRVGSPEGSISSVIKNKERKTAAEVNQTASQNDVFSTNSVERFCEPLSELFQMMWDYLKNNKVPLLFSNNQIAEKIPMEVYNHDFIVLAGPSGKSANPDLIAAQIQSLAFLIQSYPAMGQFIRGHELLKLITDQIDPKLTELIVVDPQVVPGPGQAPIEQQLAQLQQLVMGQNGIAQQVGSMSQYLGSIAAQEVNDEEMKKGKNETVQ